VKKNKRKNKARKCRKKEEENRRYRSVDLKNKKDDARRRKIHYD
jgi:hypothetical protein